MNKHISLYGVFRSIMNCFVIACGISLILLFFYPETEQLTKNEVRSIVHCVLVLNLLMYGMYKLFENIFVYKMKSKELLLNEDYLPYAVRKSNETQEIEEYNRRVTASHEAGHAVMIYINADEDFGVDMLPSPPHTIFVSKFVGADMIKNKILITYAGAAAEEILLGEFHDGCLGTERADFESANKLIKAYIVMSDKSLSKTLLDVELATQMIELSKEFYLEAKNILTDNMELLKAVSSKLIEIDTLRREDVQKLSEDIITDNNTSDSED